MTITAAHTSLIDIAVATYGRASAAVQLAIVNDIATSATIALGTQLQAIPGARYELAPFKSYSSTRTAQQQVFIAANQSLYDIAIQEHGSAAAAVYIAIANDRSISAALTAGATLNTTTVQVLRPQLVAAFKRDGYVVATAATRELSITPQANGYVQPGYVLNGYVRL